MTHYEATTWSIGNIGFLERAFRAALGLAVLIAALHLSIENVTAYPYAMKFATLLVLSGIAGWDPFYAIARKMVMRMKQSEFMTFSIGNINMPDRLIRIFLGSTVLIYSLEVSPGNIEAYPFLKIFASLIVLTGIAGWDPLYAAFRSVLQKFSYFKSRYHWHQVQYS